MTALGRIEAGLGRLPGVDAARGLALLAMFGYHFAWDLNNFQLTQLPLFTHPFWLAARAVILSAFLLIAGFSLVLATRRNRMGEAYLKRLAGLVIAALAVTAGTYVIAPNKVVLFGVLHCIAVASVLALPFRTISPLHTVSVAALFIVFPQLYAHPSFDRPLLQWIGLVTGPPQTIDYVPLLPWFGVFLLGVAAGRHFSGRDLPRIFAATPANAGIRALGFAGRHSLVLYLLHQPAFFALLWACIVLIRP